MREYHALSDEQYGLVVWVTEREEGPDAPATKTYELERWDGSEHWDRQSLAYSILRHFLGYPPRNRLLEEFARKVIPEEPVWDIPDEEVAAWMVSHHFLAFGE